MPRRSDFQRLHVERWAEEAPAPRDVVLVVSHQTVEGESLGSPCVNSKAGLVWGEVPAALGVHHTDAVFVHTQLVPSAAGVVTLPGAPAGYRDADVSSAAAVQATRTNLCIDILTCLLCGQRPVAVLLLTPLGGPALCGREIRCGAMPPYLCDCHDWPLFLCLPADIWARQPGCLLSLLDPPCCLLGY